MLHLHRPHPAWHLLQYRVLVRKSVQRCTVPCGKNRISQVSVGSRTTFHRRRSFRRIGTYHLFNFLAARVSDSDYNLGILLSLPRRLSPAHYVTNPKRSSMGTAATAVPCFFIREKQQRKYKGNSKGQGPLCRAGFHWLNNLTLRRQLWKYN